MAFTDDGLRGVAPGPARKGDGVRYDLRLVFECAAILAARLPPFVVASRVVEAALAYLCDVCALQAAGDDGLVTAVAAKRPRAQSAAERAFAAAFADPDGALHEAIRAGRPLLFVDETLGVSPAELSVRALLDATRGRSLIVVPLTLRTGSFGTLCFVEAAREAPFDVDDLELALAVGRHVAIGLENAALLERQRRSGERSRFLARATDRLFETMDEGELLRHFLRAITEEFADGAVAASLGREGLQILATAPAGDPGQGILDRFPGQEIFGEAVEAQLIAAIGGHHPLLVNDPVKAAALLRASLAEQLRPVAWMMAPLFVDAKNYGAVVCYSVSRRYEEHDREILEELCRRASLALEHAESFERERRLTQTLQQATLPSNLAVVPDATLSAVYLPASREQRVGGDWYDAFPLEDGRILLTVGDVTGHGLEASIIMGKLRHALNVVAMYEEDPARILDMAERIVLRRYPSALATAFAAVVDTANGTITYANAGHPQPILRLNDGSLRTLDVRGLPIGLRNLRESGRSVRERLDPVALLVLYTDGLTEATRNVVEGERRLADALGRDAVLLVRSAADFIRACCLEGPAPDDVAILALNFVTVDRWSFDSTDRRGARAARAAFVARLRQRLANEEEVHAAELIFGELAANVARYAPGQVDVVVEWPGREGGPILHMIDRGSGYPLADRPRPSDLFAESGRGLWLIDVLGGGFRTETIPGFGTHARVELRAAAIAGTREPS